MVMPEMLKYYTTASWIRGYISSMDQENEVNRAVIYRLQMAADLLQEAWDVYAKQEGL
jgi:hypothetical protein